MKGIVCLIIMIAAIAAGCKKGNQVIAEGTVMQVNGSEAFVRIHNADPARYSFLCNDPYVSADPTTPGNSCGNSVIILNLPEALAVEGKQITFSRFKDKGPKPIWSYAFAAHDILVYDARER
ncbi:MAG: hypothetical protein ACTHMM_04575 [Agriterribacter sp.]